MEPNYIHSHGSVLRVISFILIEPGTNFGAPFLSPQPSLILLRSFWQKIHSIYYGNEWVYQILKESVQYVDPKIVRTYLMCLVTNIPPLTIHTNQNF